MARHQQRWAATFTAALAAVTATAMAGIAGFPAWVIALVALLGLVVVGWLVSRAEGLSRGRMERLEAPIAELEAAAGAAPAGARVESADDAAARVLAASRRLQRRLDDSERQRAELGELFGALDEPVVALDRGGVITLCNAAAERLLGVKADRLVGRTSVEAFTQLELVQLHEQAQRGRAGREQIRVPSAEGVRMWEVAAAPVVGRVGEVGAAGAGGVPAPVVLSIRDVTEQSRALQVKSDFVVNASHELRTPIAGLRVAVDTLAGLPEGETRMRERLVGMIGSSIARLEDMIRDLLDLSRLESAEAGVRTEPLAASELAAALSTDFEPICRERKLTLSFELGPELERMRTDRNLILLILGNLVDNATKFAFEGSTVRVVGMAAPGGGGGPGGGGAGVSGGGGGVGRLGARFEVIDKGVGIPLNQQQRVFERFYQIDEARTGGSPRRGTGLGLAIVKHAVRRLGGTIRISSVWQQGTTMTVELPECVEVGGASMPR